MRKILGLLLISFTLVGCSKEDKLKEEINKAQAEKKAIKISFLEDSKPIDREYTDWIELDQIKTRQNIRNTFDNLVGTISFDRASKNGVLYVGEDRNWSGNNTLYNSFMNKAFVDEYWNNINFKDKIAEKAIKEFSDIKENKYGAISALNSYFNIIPELGENKTGLNENLTRGEVLSAVCRADTPVQFIDSTEFEKVVGRSNLSNTAFLVANNSYLRYNNGELNYSTFNTPMTRGELAYLIANRYFGYESDYIGEFNGYSERAYELEYKIQTEEGIPLEISNAIKILKIKGIIDDSFDWLKPVQGGYLLSKLIDTYKVIYDEKELKINQKLGNNTGLNKTEEIVKEVLETETSLDGGELSKIKDVTNLEVLKEIYGNEINMTEEEWAEIKKNTDGWTFDKADKYMEVAYCNNLNVRTGPSTDYRIVKTVPVGTKAHIVAICKENGWYRIIADGKVIYQSGVYFK